MSKYPKPKPRTPPKPKPKPRPRGGQRLLLLLLLLPLCVGCLMPSDLRNLKVSQDSYKQEMQTSLDRYREGAISKDDLRDEVARSEKRYDARLENQIEVITKRTESALQAGKEGMTVLEGTGLTGAAVVALNLYRSFTRKKNLETLVAEGEQQRELDRLRQSMSLPGET